MPAPLPFATPELPGTGGALRAAEEDFRVEEVPAYEPSGSGTHVFALVEKRGVDTPGAIRGLAGALGVDPRDVGAAGLKDRHAVTRQYLSFPPPVTPEALFAARVGGVEVKEARPHPHKLKTGHLRGNRFVLRVTGLEIEAEQAAERARAILERLASAPGSPNYFGQQRFGRDGRNAEVGRALVRGETPPGRPPRGRKRRLFISAFQSHLFNEFLRRRIEDGLLGRALEGDILMKIASGGSFASEDVAVDQERLEAGEVVPTGPMFGHRMKAPPEGSPAAQRELQILDEEGLELSSFRPLGKLATGTRRALAVAVRDFSVTPAGPGAIEVCFELPAGSYATAVMREVMKQDGTVSGKAA